MPLATALAEGKAHLSLTCRELGTIPLQLLASSATETLMSLDLSRNLIDELPAGLACLRRLVVLDVSRNRLRAIPAELPPALRSLVLLSNQLRRRSLPLISLAALSDLTLLDLRFNSKLGSADTATALNAALPASSLKVLCVDGATAHCPGLLGLTLQAPGCDTQSGRATESSRAQRGAAKAADVAAPTTQASPVRGAPHAIATPGHVGCGARRAQQAAEAVGSAGGCDAAALSAGAHLNPAAPRSP